MWPKEFLKSMHRDKSAKMAIWQKIAILPFGHFFPCASTSLIGFQKFFLFWVAGMILNVWDVELEPAISFGI